MAKEDIEKLVRRVHQKADGKAQVKVRTLLKAFGYSRRSPEGVRSIHEQLAVHGITSELTVSNPATLDGFITLVCGSAAAADSGPEATGREPVPALTMAVPVTSSPVTSTRPPADAHAEPPADVPGVEATDLPHEAEATIEAPRSFADRLFRAAKTFFTMAPPTVLGINSTAAGETPPSTLSHAIVGEEAAGVRPAPPVSRKKGTDTGAAGAPVIVEVPVPTVRLLEHRSDAGQSVAIPALSSVAEQTIRATVFVKVDDGFGSGFIVHPDGLVVTACHVLDTRNGIAGKATIRLHDGRESTASLVRAHRSLDFALLWLDKPGTYPALPIGKAENLRYAETVLAVGHPGVPQMSGEVQSLANTVSTGIVANPSSTHRGVEWIQMTTDIDPGNSGGPLVNRQGEVVGINCWKYLAVAAAKMALPLDYIEQDVAGATRLGRGGHSAGRICSICGSFESESEDWFCCTCGAGHRSATNDSQKGTEHG